MRLLSNPIAALDLDLPSQAKAQVPAIMEAALLAVDPGKAVTRSMDRQGIDMRVGAQVHDLDSYEHIYVVGAGKASAAMAVALDDALGQRLTEGWVNVKDGYTVATKMITIHEAGHPFPDDRGVGGSEKIASLVRKAGRNDLIVCLISGGGSALVTFPVEGLHLSYVESLTQALLRCGATINEINAARKHISQLKGGQLARLEQPAEVVWLIFPDVVGNPLDVIASGPTSPDSSTFAQAYSVLQKYGLLDTVPRAVVDHLQRGVDGLVPGTATSGDAAFRRTQNVLVGSNGHAAQAAVDEAAQRGLHSQLLSTFIEGEARAVAKVMASLERDIEHSGRPLARPASVVAGGETTVTVQGQGQGERNQELALAAAPRLAGLDDVAVVALGTDGTDGPTDAAGAVATGRTMHRAQQKGLSHASYLADNDAYRFIQALGDLIISGPTNTNVNDLILIFAY